MGRQKETRLPEPSLTGSVSVEYAIGYRRSRREFSPRALNLGQVSQLLWSAYGISGANDLRTAPSAKELYPLRIHLVAGQVTGLDAGAYRYLSAGHRLEIERSGDLREPLFESTFDQKMVKEAAAVILFCAIFEAAEAEFGSGARVMVYADLGHAAQNVYLQVEALELATVAVGAIKPVGIQELLGLPENEIPLYLMPVGRRKEEGDNQSAVREESLYLFGRRSRR